MALIRETPSVDTARDTSGSTKSHGASDGHSRSWRIAHVLGSVDPCEGGPGTVVCRLAAAQASMGHQVSIISSLSPGARADFAKSTEKIPGFHRVQLLVNPWTTVARRWFGARLLPVYQTLFDYLDVVHIHGVWEPMLIVAAAQARRVGIPYIVRPCGMLDPWNLMHRSWKKKLALSLSHRGMVNRASLIHTLNHDEQRLIQRLHLKPKHMIIPNAVFLDEVDDPSGEKEFAARFPQLSGQPYVLFLGRLHQKKGLDILIEAFAQIVNRHPTTRLLIVGPDGGERAETLRRAAELNVEDRIDMPGPLFGAAKFAAYRHATCFCLPSRQEGFSLSITEALASRAPVVISEGCHFPEVATSGAGEIAALNPGAVAEGLDKILNATPARRQMFGEAARSLVEKNFTWERVAAITVGAYRTMSPSLAGETADRLPIAAGMHVELR